MKKLRFLVSAIVVGSIIGTSTVLSSGINTSVKAAAQNSTEQGKYIPSYMKPGTVIKFDDNKKMSIVKEGTVNANLISKTEKNNLTNATPSSDLPDIKSNMTVIYDALGAPVVSVPKSKLDDNGISIEMKELSNNTGEQFSPSYLHSESGIVSYYDIWAGDTASGLKAADGAAHKTIPLRTYVEVDNLRNGKGYTVWILDRGPYVAGRILDMSEESFSKVEDLSRGLFNGQIFWN